MYKVCTWLWLTNLLFREKCSLIRSTGQCLCRVGLCWEMLSWEMSNFKDYDTGHGMIRPPPIKTKLSRQKLLSLLQFKFSKTVPMRQEHTQAQWQRLWVFPFDVNMQLGKVIKVRRYRAPVTGCWAYLWEDCRGGSTARPALIPGVRAAAGCPENGSPIVVVAVASNLWQSREPLPIAFASRSDPGHSGAIGRYTYIE